jgi:hypothetical protein
MADSEQIEGAVGQGDCAAGLALTPDVGEELLP